MRRALSHPTAVTACNLDLENLLQDVNRSIATLAITTLLKTGSENSIDRLMRSISAFLQDISDEFKVVVVEALRSLALQYPRKQAVLMGQLADMLRSEGGLAYKEAIAGTIITIIEDNGEAKEKGLDYLCEFIEDCEHTTLAVRILHLLGKEGPRTLRPQRYIRFIYNRVLLENPAVRAAAVSVLARFGATVPRLLPNVLVLLQRCRLDCEDEVRDRSTYYHALLSTGDPHVIARGILNPPRFALPSLERALIAYLDGDTSAPFDPAPLPSAAPTPAPRSHSRPVRGQSARRVRRAAGGYPGVRQARPALQELCAGGADGERDRVRGALREAHLRQAYRAAVRCHQHPQRPAARGGHSRSAGRRGRGGAVLPPAQRAAPRLPPLRLPRLPRCPSPPSPTAPPCGTATPPLASPRLRRATRTTTPW